MSTTSFELQLTGRSQRALSDLLSKKDFNFRKITTVGKSYSIDFKIINLFKKIITSYNKTYTEYSSSGSFLKSDISAKIYLTGGSATDLASAMLLDREPLQVGGDLDFKIDFEKYPLINRVYPEPLKEFYVTVFCCAIKELFIDSGQAAPTDSEIKSYFFQKLKLFDDLSAFLVNFAGIDFSFPTSSLTKSRCYTFNHEALFVYLKDISLTRSSLNDFVVKSAVGDTKETIEEIITNKVIHIKEAAEIQYNGFERLAYSMTKGWSIFDPEQVKILISDFRKRDLSRLFNLLEAKKEKGAEFLLNMVLNAYQLCSLDATNQSELEDKFNKNWATFSRFFSSDVQTALNHFKSIGSLFKYYQVNAHFYSPQARSPLITHLESSYRRVGQEAKGYLFLPNLPLPEALALRCDFDDSLFNHYEAEFVSVTHDEKLTTFFCIRALSEKEDIFHLLPVLLKVISNNFRLEYFRKTKQRILKSLKSRDDLSPFLSHFIKDQPILWTAPIRIGIDSGISDASVVEYLIETVKSHPEIKPLFLKGFTDHSYMFSQTDYFLILENLLEPSTSVPIEVLNSFKDLAPETLTNLNISFWLPKIETTIVEADFLTNTYLKEFFLETNAFDPLFSKWITKLLTDTASLTYIALLCNKESFIEKIACAKLSKAIRDTLLAAKLENIFPKKQAQTWLNILALSESKKVDNLNALIFCANYLESGAFCKFVLTYYERLKAFSDEKIIRNEKINYTFYQFCLIVLANEHTLSGLTPLINNCKTYKSLYATLDDLLKDPKKKFEEIKLRIENQTSPLTDDQIQLFIKKFSPTEDVINFINSQLTPDRYLLREEAFRVWIPKTPKEEKGALLQKYICSHTSLSLLEKLIPEWIDSFKTKGAFQPDLALSTKLCNQIHLLDKEPLMGLFLHYGSLIIQAFALGHADQEFTCSYFNLLNKASIELKNKYLITLYEKFSYFSYNIQHAILLDKVSTDKYPIEDKSLSLYNKLLTSFDAKKTDKDAIVKLISPLKCKILEETESLSIIKTEFLLTYFSFLDLDIDLDKNRDEFSADFVTFLFKHLTTIRTISPEIRKKIESVFHLCPLVVTSSLNLQFIRYLLNKKTLDSTSVLFITNHINSCTNEAEFTEILTIIDTKRAQFETPIILKILELGFFDHILDFNLDEVKNLTPILEFYTQYINKLTIESDQPIALKFLTKLFTLSITNSSKIQLLKDVLLKKCAEMSIAFAPDSDYGIFTLLIFTLLKLYAVKSDTPSDLEKLPMFICLLNNNLRKLASRSRLENQGQLEHFLMTLDIYIEFIAKLKQRPLSKTLNEKIDIFNKTYLYLIEENYKILDENAKTLVANSIIDRIKEDDITNTYYFLTNTAYETLKCINSFHFLLPLNYVKILAFYKHFITKFQLLEDEEKQQILKDFITNFTSKTIELLELDSINKIHLCSLFIDSIATSNIRNLKPYEALLLKSNILIKNLIAEEHKWDSEFIHQIVIYLNSIRDLTEELATRATSEVELIRDIQREKNHFSQLLEHFLVALIKNCKSKTLDLFKDSDINSSLYEFMFTMNPTAAASSSLLAEYSVRNLLFYITDNKEFLIEGYHTEIVTPLIAKLKYGSPSNIIGNFLMAIKPRK
jgi:hypothetical protein